eukprot:TRINITY_DN1261_c0_g1_i2.p2 TRINITY_DN1261_c0_g1~~TRINITY_DN1261_c0_g1_i2.p2  ORF type:complete len:514 (-),score=67.95 TRINITY_DN1261_c0_g1_i2:931-2472(-)
MNQAFNRISKTPEEKKVQVKEIEIVENAEINAQKMQEFSPAPSVASMASLTSVNNSTTSAGFNEMIQEFQIQSVSQQTPPSIKKLFMGIIVMLVITASLICLSAYMFLKEKKSLVQRVELINEYQMRYKMAITITGMFRSYEGIRSIPIPLLDWFLDVFLERATSLMEYNEKTRKLLFSQNLHYDEELLSIPDPYEGERVVSFSHSLLVVLFFLNQNLQFVNTIIDFSQYKHASLMNCTTNPMLPLCVYTSKQVNYAFDLMFYHMRFKQDEVNFKLEEELKSMARKGENTQYAIILSCIGLVILSTIVIIPVFNWVIKEKSNVLSIFADIEPAEARKVVEECQKLDIKNLKYKRKWIGLASGHQNLLWNKIIAEQQRGFGKNEYKKEKVLVKDKEDDDFSAHAKKVVATAGKGAVTVEEVKQEKKKSIEKVEQQNVENEISMSNLEEITRKRKKRKELLSEPEYFQIVNQINLASSCGKALFYGQQPCWYFSYAMEEPLYTSTITCTAQMIRQ